MIVFILNSASKKFMKKHKYFGSFHVTEISLILGLNGSFLQIYDCLISCLAMKREYTQMNKPVTQ